MALFKIFNNIDSQGSLPSTYTKGYMYFDATTGVFYIDTAGTGGTTGTRMAVNAYGAQKAYADENNDRISTTYLKDADYGALLDSLSVARKIDGLTFNYTKNISRYGVCSTGASTAAKTVSIDDVDALTTGLVIYVKFDNSNTASNPTLQVNNLTAKSIKRYGTTAVGTNTNTAWTAGAIISFLYDGSNWVELDYALRGNDNTYPSAYCSTAAGTAAKTASCTDYALLNSSYLHVLIKTSNTAAGALTLNVNSKGAKPIFINGEASSSTNYTLPAGTYIVYYDSTAYYFRTDGLLPGLGTAAAASKIAHTLTFGNGTYVYDGSADVTVPVYTGTYSTS